MEKQKVLAEAAKIAINPTGYLLNQIVQSTLGNMSDPEGPVSEIDELRLESERQELQMRIAEAQAKVAQEIAIAKRIETAEEVEMEEFYDYSGSGKLGVAMDQQSMNIGASGEGKRVSKRIYRFKGSSVQTS
ncbi:hypothetical protein PTW35_08975 [Photobacterium sp. DA100]|uniref:hypothetical protein n=1 Tax=Photobacterium sp. DA100 TaxID=3027472 RepID=UPI00247A164D|nr:hypothetical protein [Photobacterium sp. DA100]WEM43889.1 hypothetical protein PTW35_08975 [Photobacterium sp. DA100]